MFSFCYQACLDLVGGAVTASMASSSTSGNSLPIIIEASSNIGGRAPSPACSCVLTPARALYLESPGLQKQDTVNALRPLKYVADSKQQLQCSSSSGSFNKSRNLGSVPEMQKSRNQNIGSQIPTIIDAEASPVDKVITPAVSSPTTTASRVLPYAFFLVFLLPLFFIKFGLLKVIITIAL